MSRHADLQWLRDLHEDLWPPDHKDEYAGDLCLKLNAARELTNAELRRFFWTIEEYDLMTSMFMTSMFGGYGLEVYEPPVSPKRSPPRLVSIIEGHLPTRPTLWEHITDEVKVLPEKIPGCGREDAWAAFSPYTHSEKNAKRLEFCGMDPPRDQVHYCY